MSETGVVKFRCDHVTTELPPFVGMEELNNCRRQLFERGLIGVDSSGIGFGNLSVRAEATSNFFITGSGTGALAELRLEHYAEVTAYDFDRNWLRCTGTTIASSESLTHAAIYQADERVNAIIHCHSNVLWARLLNVAPTTGSGVEYGTSEMANEVRRLFETSEVKERKIFLMGGHEGGILAFNHDIAGALEILLRSVS